MTLLAKVPCLLFDSPLPVMRKTLPAEIDSGLLDQIKADPSFAIQRLKEYLAYLHYELADDRLEKPADIQAVGQTMCLLYLASLDSEDLHLKRFVADGTCFLRGLYLKTSLKEAQARSATQDMQPSDTEADVDVIYTGASMTSDTNPPREACHA